MLTGKGVQVLVSDLMQETQSNVLQDVGTSRDR
jgi:hypothetical protein